MSLTVSQLLELPCLRRARVLAGHKKPGPHRDQHLRAGIRRSHRDPKEAV